MTQFPLYPNPSKKYDEAFEALRYECFEEDKHAHEYLTIHNRLSKGIHQALVGALASGCFLLAGGVMYYFNDPGGPSIDTLSEKFIIGGYVGSTTCIISAFIIGKIRTTYYINIETAIARHKGIQESIHQTGEELPI